MGKYTEASVQTLEPKDHIRLRPGMYIGKLGDGSSVDDGIYVLLKEVIDNSVAWDTPIVIKKDGYTKLPRIGELIDSLIEEKPEEAYRKNGLEKIRNTKGIEALCFDKEELKMKYKRVFSFIRHKVNSKLYRVKLTGGRYVDITPYHSLFTLKEDKVVAASLETLKENDYVLVPRVGWEEGGATKEINLLDELEKMDVRKTKQIALSNISNLLRKNINLRKEIEGECKKKYSLNDYTQKDYLPFEVYRSLSNKNKDEIKDRCVIGSRYTKIKPTLSITKELIELLGIYAAEGSIRTDKKNNGKTVIFSFGSKEKELINHTIKLVWKAFGIEAKTAAAHESSTNVAIYSNFISLIFEEILGTQTGCSKKIVPSLVLSAKKEWKKRYLIGYLSGDGYPSKKFIKHLVEGTEPNEKDTSKFGFNTVSKDLAIGIQYLIGAIEKTCSVRTVPVKEETEDEKIINAKKKYNIKRKLTVYAFDFYWNGKKSYVNYVPINNLFKNEGISLAKNASGISIARIEKRLLKEKANKYKLRDGIEKFVKGDLGLCKIRKIEEIEYKEPWVYDICVEGDENFVGGFGPIICHNSVDEYVMGGGKEIIISLQDKSLEVRDFGRGIPLGSIVDCASVMNTGAKYNSEAFEESVGLNGVGIKAVNALSQEFYIQSWRDGKTKYAKFSQGNLLEKSKEIRAHQKENEKNGTLVRFTPDEEIFTNFKWIEEYVVNMLWNYAFLNKGLKLIYGEQEFVSKEGLKDLLIKKNPEEVLYPIIHLEDKKIEMAITHGDRYGEEYSFTNGQYTSQGGSHLNAFREGVLKTLREYYKKEWEAVDVRNCLIGAISIRVKEPVFESQTKTKLGSTSLSKDGPTIRSFVVDFIKKELDDYLHKNRETSEALLSKLNQNERERKDMAGIKDLARERAKKASLHNKKLRDCRVHLNSNDKRRLESTLFITEGDSASGSITKVRDVNTQAVFSLRGKPLNCFNEKKRIVYENEEFNLLQSALNIEESLENLRYNTVVISSDSDVDGMHIRLLLTTFFLQFFPELIKNGHLHILQTPLFRVRNKKETIYCYSEEEKIKAQKKLGPNPEITRFKGLGEISPDEFRHFIDKNMRLEPVIIERMSKIPKMLEFYMGSNDPNRRDFIIENLNLNV